MRDIPAVIIYLTGFVSTICILFCGIYFNSNKTIGIWTLFVSIVFGLLTGFLYWQNDIWKTQASFAEKINKQPAPNQEPAQKHQATEKKEIKKSESNHLDSPQRPAPSVNQVTEAKQPTELEVGEDSVVMGNVPPNIKVGNGSVIIGPTDNRGNTIINTPMAVGRGAKAGPGSIAIGAHAGAGLQEVTPLK